MEILDASVRVFIGFVVRRGKNGEVWKIRG